MATRLHHGRLAPMVALLLAAPVATTACSTSISSDGGSAPDASTNPNVEFVTASGDPMQVTAQRDTNIIVLPFWKTTCDPCKVELADLDVLYRELAPRGLQVYAINVDPPGTRGQVQGWIDRGQWSYETLFDPETEILTRFNPGGECPFYVVLAADGSVLRSHGGYLKGDADELGAFLREHLPPA